MFDFSKYAAFMLENTEKKDISELILLLDNLTMLKQEKNKLLSSLTVTQFNQLLESINNHNPNVTSLFIQFHELGQIKNVDRLNTAFRRRLRNNGIQVIEIESATPVIDKTAIENKFGNDAIYIYRLNSTLIAGIKIKTFEGEFEFSLNQHLIDLSNALVA